MTRTWVRAALAAACGVLACPAGALAQEPPAVTPIQPAFYAQVPRGSDVTYRVRADAATTRVQITVVQEDTEPRVVDRVEARREGDDWLVTLPAPDRPGPYEWYADAARPDGAGGETVSGSQPVAFDVVVPAVQRRRTTIPRRFGRHRRPVRILLSTRGIPRGVPAARFKTIAASAARRWGMRVVGWTKLPASGRFDRTTVAGFAGRRFFPSGQLGATRVRVRARRFRRCVVRREPGGREVSRTCGPVQTGPRRYDRDVLLRADVPWWPGPEYPDLGSIDLETVVLHEFGHLAGNKRHQPRCTGSPLDVATARGEWWRTPGDWWQTGC